MMAMVVVVRDEMMVTLRVVVAALVGIGWDLTVVGEQEEEKAEEEQAAEVIKEVIDEVVVVVQAAAAVNQEEFPAAPVTAARIESDKS